MVRVLIYRCRNEHETRVLEWKAPLLDCPVCGEPVMLVGEEEI